ncbi:MAG: hypothetical protein FWG15_07700 [Propionibacteriaceae bacterium]|nr:hypothetical protein [Propionibacteriaceae bacterium]
MAEPLKNYYSRDSLKPIVEDIARVYPPFAVEGFLDAVVSEPWDDLELKARIGRISETLRAFLPEDYPSAIAVIDQVVGNNGTWLDGFSFFFPTFVEKFGVSEEHWDVSVGALERYTPYASAEFAVRPFIVLDQTRMMAQMLAWTEHENECVRRLASEGCRPLLPWAPVLASFKKDPSPILPILEKLKADPSSHVRTSVANISEVNLAAGDKRYYERRFSFADLSTRKHYPGVHSVTLVINGVERETVSFELVGPGDCVR